MNDILETGVVLATTTIKIYMAVSSLVKEAREKLGQPGKPLASTFVNRPTPMTDEQVLALTLSQLALKLRTGNEAQVWGRPVEFSIADESGQPWFALSRPQNSQVYEITLPEAASSQDDALTERRVSRPDAEPLISLILQQYDCNRPFSALLGSGFRMRSAATVRRDGMQEITLERIDPSGGEMQIVSIAVRNAAARPAC
jgi:hypothetical protein